MGERGRGVGCSTLSTSILLYFPADSSNNSWDDFALVSYSFSMILVMMRKTAHNRRKIHSAVWRWQIYGVLKLCCCTHCEIGSLLLRLCALVGEGGGEVAGHHLVSHKHHVQFLDRNEKKLFIVFSFLNGLSHEMDLAFEDMQGQFQALIYTKMGVKTIMKAVA